MRSPLIAEWWTTSNSTYYPISIATSWLRDDNQCNIELLRTAQVMNLQKFSKGPLLPGLEVQFFHESFKIH